MALEHTAVSNTNGYYHSSAAPAVSDSTGSKSAAAVLPVKKPDSDSKMFDRIYGGFAKSGDTNAAPWMNCGYIPADWTPSQLYDLVDECVNNGLNTGRGEKYKACCAALAMKMYTAIPLPSRDLESATGKLSVLDCGCGYGAQSILFKQNFPDTKYTGINISGQQIEMARKFCKDLSDVTFEEADATDLSTFPDNCFDGIFALECAFHFDTRLDYMREAYRVLKPGGTYAAMDCIPTENSQVRRADGVVMPNAHTWKNIMHVAWAVWSQCGFFWMMYTMYNRLFGLCLYGPTSWPVNKEVSCETYEESLREVGFAKEVRCEDISDRVFMYNKVLQDRILGLDQCCCARWLSPKGWYLAAKFLFTEWSANPIILAIVCRSDFSPYVLATARK